MLLKIVSGGQTGVDRAALDAALAISFPCGGWCPHGRRAEDGVIPLDYPLKETDQAAYEIRTRLNVRDSDGTLIITRGKPTGGTAYTIAETRKTGCPCLVIDLDEEERKNEIVSTVVTAKITTWMNRERICVLNVAGPRESKISGIYKDALRVIKNLLDE